MNAISAIKIVKPGDFDTTTAQTAGSTRSTAIAPQTGASSSMWGGLFEVAPGQRTGIHHHGQQQTIAFMLQGDCEIRWGAKGEFSARAETGDFIHVPAFLLHREINLSQTEPFRWVVVRSTATPIVVNYPDNSWD